MFIDCYSQQYQSSIIMVQPDSHHENTSLNTINDNDVSHHNKPTHKYFCKHCNFYTNYLRIIYKHNAGTRHLNNI